MDGWVTGDGMGMMKKVKLKQCHEDTATVLNEPVTSVRKQVSLVTVKSVEREFVQ